MQYYEPNFVGEALVLLDRFGAGARLLAGGSRVAFELRHRGNEIDALINLKRIKELSRIEQADGRLFIGALATAATLASNELVLRDAPLLACAAHSLGAQQLRSVATLGGNVCSGDPASDLSVALLACGAQCEVLRPERSGRSVSIEAVLASDSPVLEAGELLEGVWVPRHSSCWSYQKMTTRRAFEMALVSVAFCAQLDRNAVREPRLAIAGAAPACVRARSAEQVIANQPLTLDLIREAARRAGRQDASPIDDSRATAEFRRHLVTTLAERAMHEAIDRAKQG